MANKYKWKWKPNVRLRLLRSYTFFFYLYQLCLGRRRIFMSNAISIEHIFGTHWMRNQGIFCVCYKHTMLFLHRVRMRWSQGRNTMKNRNENRVRIRTLLHLKVIFDRTLYNLFESLIESEFDIIIITISECVCVCVFHKYSFRCTSQVSNQNFVALSSLFLFSSFLISFFFFFSSTTYFSTCHADSRWSFHRWRYSHLREYVKN